MFSSFKIKAFRGFNHMLPSKVRLQKSQQQQHELHSSNVILGLEFKLPPPPHIVYDNYQQISLQFSTHIISGLSAGIDHDML